MAVYKAITLRNPEMKPVDNSATLPKTPVYFESECDTFEKL
jgi:hypothetical protein